MRLRTPRDPLRFGIESCHCYHLSSNRPGSRDARPVFYAVSPQHQIAFSQTVGKLVSSGGKNIASRSQTVVAGCTDGSVLAASPPGCWLLFVSGVLKVSIGWVVA